MRGGEETNMKTTQRKTGAIATAILAAGAMLCSLAVVPAQAVDGTTCTASSDSSFTDAINNTNCSTIEVKGDSNGLLKFNAATHDIIKVASWEGYDKPDTFTINRPVTITSSSDVILRNVKFDVVTGGSLTLAGHTIVDDAELSGLTLLDLISLGTGAEIAGFDYAIQVSGNGVLTLEDQAHVASGTGTSTTEFNRAIVAKDQAVINLNSTGTYDRQSKKGLASLDLTILGMLGSGLTTLLNTLLGLLSVDRDAAYPTVWGRDASIYSDPAYTGVTINITNGEYSNQKDKEPLGKTGLNGAISTSGTVNIVNGTNPTTEAVKISSIKIGNAVTSDHAGSNAVGTLNIDHANATFDPAVESDTNAQKASTGSWAVELRGAATMNLVRGQINDTLNTSTDSQRIIESESTSRINILAANKGDVTIANRAYYISKTAQNGAGFKATTNIEASASDANPAGYELWSSDATAVDGTAKQLAAITAKEAAGASDPNAAKLGTSAYDSTNATITAAAPESTKRAIYGRYEIASTDGAAPFHGVNNGTPGTAVLYGLPWASTYEIGNVPSVDGKLFAGWYTSANAWSTEDSTQGSSLQASDKHHSWGATDTTWNNVAVVSKDYTGTLYPHFVDAATMGLFAQTAAASNGSANRRDLRLLSGVDSYNFAKLTFKVTYNGKTLTLNSTTAYDYVTADGAKQTYALNPFVTADNSGFATNMFGTQGQARYVSAVVVKNVPAGAALTVVPQWTTLDGTVVTGSTYTATVGTDGQPVVNKQA